MSNFSEIKTRRDLSVFLDIPLNKLTFVLYKQRVEDLYTSFEIPKKNGGTRLINAPNRNLKYIQKKLAKALCDHQELINSTKKNATNISHAFQKGKGIITNAKIHKNKRYLVNVDLENYFSSFHFGRVRGYFAKNRDFGLPLEVATIIAQLVCCNGSLPQGAPSSPIITNLISQIFDFRVLKLSKKYKLDYTRYADDLTFSTNNKSFIDRYSNFIDELVNEITLSGFKINNNKTRFIFKDSRQIVTGLVVNKKINVSKDFCKETRAMAHSLYTTGELYINNEIASINQLEGRFSFINQLDSYNNGSMNPKKRYNTLNSHEKQYYKFLFFKYFFANNTPLIVTEGETDIVYIKSALKNLCDIFPNLISRHSPHTFEYKINFLHRNARFDYFFGISKHGADTIQKIFDLYNGSNNAANLFEYFSRICKYGPLSPVILVFDNEMNSSNKPLAKFLRNCKLPDEKISAFSVDLNTNLIGNLFLVTNPLAENKKESEIEDLFSTETLDIEIANRRFSRVDKYDATKFFGKKYFSKYVASNYKTIDFSNFIPYLTIINNIVCANDTNISLESDHRHQRD